MADNPSGITERSPPKLLLFTIFTFGFYWLVHVNRINREFRDYLDADYNPGMRTFMYIIPFVSFYAVWQMGQSANEVNEDINPGLAAVGFLIPLIGAFIVQPDINAKATGE